MRNLAIIPVSLTAALAVTACHVSTSPLGDLSGGPSNGVVNKDYVEAPLAGKLFGQKWQEGTATVTAFGGDGKQVSLNLFGNTLINACAGNLANLPDASVVIPANYVAQEYPLTLSSGTPLVFSSTSTSSTKNLFADIAKLKITTLSATGFDAYLYAHGVDTDGTPSEINGKFNVTDCRKLIAFSVWDEFTQTYTLTQLDGQTVGPMTAAIQYDTTNFFDSTGRSNLRTLVLPLYTSVNGTSAVSYNFGPMEGIGQTNAATNNGVKTLTYSYHGPIVDQGTAITLNLDLTLIEAADQTVQITYTLEIPGQIAKSSHILNLTPAAANGN